MEFIEAPTFTAIVADYLEDDEYRALQLFLAGDPEVGDVMPGTGGFRKLRWADRRRGKGKRGGLRTIYYYLSADAQIWLMTLYDKDEMADLSAAEKRALKAALEVELARRAARRRLTKEVNYGSEEATGGSKKAQPLRRAVLGRGSRCGITAKDGSP